MPDDANAKLPKAVLALASLCDNEVPRLSVVQIHTEPDGDRTAVATDGRIAGLVSWTPGGASPHGTPELIPAKLLTAIQGHFVDTIEPYEGRTIDIKSVLAEPKRDQFRVNLNARNLIRVLRFMQAACGRNVAVELVVSAPDEKVVVEPIRQDYPPGLEVRAVVMPMSPYPDQQHLKPPTAYAAGDEGGDEASRNVADRNRGLVARAIAGLKNLGPFIYRPGDDPHALDCSLAGRVSRVFGVGMTMATALCHEFGHDPHYQQRDEA